MEPPVAACVDCGDDATYDGERCRECAHRRLAKRITPESLDAFARAMEQLRRARDEHS